MTWHPAVSIEIEAMFADYAWHADELQDALEQHCAHERAQGRDYRSDPWRRKRAVDATAAWRKANPERARELGREANRRYRERAKADPVKRAKLSAQNRARIRRKWEQDPERMRTWWREAQRARRARLRAEQGMPPARPYRRAA